MKGKGIKMARLINADEAFRVLSDYYHHRTETQADALREALELVPEAVVRCGECRWYYYRDDAIVCANRGEVMQTDDYCSYGERRSECAQ